MFAQRAAQIPYPPHDSLFISDDVYHWQALDELGATAFYSHAFRDGAAACKFLLQGPHLPDSERERVQKNHDMYMQRLSQEENQKNNEIMAKKQNEVMLKMEKAKDKKQAKKNKMKKSTRVESKKNKYKKRKPVKR